MRLINETILATSRANICPFPTKQIERQMTKCRESQPTHQKLLYNSDLEPVETGPVSLRFGLNAAHFIIVMDEDAALGGADTVGDRRSDRLCRDRPIS